MNKQLSFAIRELDNTTNSLLRPLFIGPDVGLIIVTSMNNSTNNNKNKTRFEHLPPVQVFLEYVCQLIRPFCKKDHFLAVRGL